MYHNALPFISSFFQFSLPLKLKLLIMDLLQELKDKAGLTNEQAQKTFEILKEFVNGKVPVFLAGTVDKWFKDIEKRAGESNKENDFLEH
ncbi:hypothetical protein SAMN05428988_2656 [Chitinophaga sp. YR573]|nr:hypothetical protein SAMN05428988_2656 [Chitinophaga sp. YR573]